MLLCTSTEPHRSQTLNTFDDLGLHFAKIFLAVFKLKGKTNQTVSFGHNMNLLMYSCLLMIKNKFLRYCLTMQLRKQCHYGSIGEPDVNTPVAVSHAHRAKLKICSM